MGRRSRVSASKKPSSQGRHGEQEFRRASTLAGAVARTVIEESATQALSPSVVDTLQRSIGNAAVVRLMRERANAGNTRLPAALKANAERLSGQDLSQVTVHYNSPRPAEFGALAYTQGTDIHVAPGQEQHLPHEAWHVVQQGQGRVRPTFQMAGGVPLNDDEDLECEADTMAGTIEGTSAGAPAHTRLPAMAARQQQATIAGHAPVQAYKSARAPDGGTMVGEPAACHCHIDIGNPHFKVGNDKGSRINFGRDMNLERMQRAYETLLAKHAGKAGYEDCKEYLEEQGCVEPEEGSLVDTLKQMLLRWGGLSDDRISFYTDEHGTRGEVHVNTTLDETIMEAEEQIRLSDSIYSHFLDGESDIDEEAMQEEANELYEQEYRAAHRK